jgi:hypothetical protein
MSSLRLTAIVFAATFAGTAHGQILPPPKPGDEQPRADVFRQAKPVTSPAAVARPLPGAVSGPGTQTEDDEYVGRKPKNLNSTPAARPLTPQGPLAAPTVQPPTARPALPVAAPGSAAPKPRLGNKTRATGDEDEMEDLDIQRRKVQGLPDTKGDAPRKEQPGGEQPRGERR